MRKVKDLTGQRFGRLTVIKLDRVENKRTFWLCKCDCGTFKIFGRGLLTSGDAVSCGCYHREHIHEFGFKHGLTNSSLYTKWSGMIQRCCNTNSANFYRYGGRGITVCDEWKNNFISFYNWAINNGYSDELTIDRIDNNKGYYPDNCRWITRKQQMSNTRNNHYITYNGVTHILTFWAKLLNVNVETLRYRVNHNNFSDFENYYSKELITIE